MRLGWANRSFGRLFRGRGTVVGGLPLPEPGERFFSASPPHDVWMVDRLIKSAVCDIPHVVIERCGIMPASKILSVAALHDPTRFRPDRRDPLSQSDTDKARRKTDKLKA